MCFIKGNRFINHSPSQNTVAPSHDEANTPTKNMKRIDVRNPRPAQDNNMNTRSDIISMRKEVQDPLRPPRISKKQEIYAKETELESTKPRHQSRKNAQLVF